MGTSAMEKFLGARSGNPQWAPIIEIVTFKDITFMIFPLFGSII